MKPIVPSAFGWSSGKTPLPRNVVATGRLRRSQKRRSASIAPSRATPGSRQDDRSLRALEDLHRAVDLRLRRRGSTGTLTAQRHALGLPLGHILRQDQERRARALGPRLLERLADHLRHAPRPRVTMPPHFVIGRKSWTRSTTWWDSLYRRSRPACAVIATSGCESRCAFAMPSMRLIAPGPRVARHTPGRPVKRAVGVGHERGAALVPGGDEADRRGGERVDHVEVLLARQAEDVLDPFVLEALDEELRHRPWHRARLPSRVRLPGHRAGTLRPWSSETCSGIGGWCGVSTSGRFRATTIDRIVDSGRRAPSAGFSQGLELLVLDTPETIATFWETTRDPEFGWEEETVAHGPTVLILPLPDARRYLERYAEPDKIDVRHGRGGELAGAVLGDRRRDGVDADPARRGRRGARRLVLRHHARGARAAGSIRRPRHLRPIGIIGLGYRAEDEEPSGSWTKHAGAPSRSRSTATAGEARR